MRACPRTSSILNIEEDDLPKAIVAAGHLISHVHVDDSNRLQPGTGHLDFLGAFDALREIGYDGWQPRWSAGCAARRRRRCRPPPPSCASSTGSGEPGPADRLRGPPRRIAEPGAPTCSRPVRRLVRRRAPAAVLSADRRRRRGVRPDDHADVDARLGTWADVAALARETGVMADVIVNHISSRRRSSRTSSRTGSTAASRACSSRSTACSRRRYGRDLLAIYRPRAGLPFTPAARRPAAPAWTTFTPDQVDLDVTHPAGAART